MTQENVKKVIRVFEYTANSDGRPYLLGTYDNWERANNVMEFYYALNEDKPNARAEAIEESIDPERAASTLAACKSPYPPAFRALRRHKMPAKDWVKFRISPSLIVRVLGYQ